MSGPFLTLETLLADVDATAALIMQSELAGLEDGLAVRALDACRRIRDAVAAGNAAGAAFAGCQLGEWLAKLRNLHAMVQRDASYKPRVQRDHERDVERRAVQEKYEKRGFKTIKADEKAAAELGVSARAIRRARRGY
jgi:hypothetical protein